MSSLTPQALAALLNGRPYRHEMARGEVLAAKAAGLVVVTGYSDDGASFIGAVNDEAGAGHGTELRFTSSGYLQSECDCADCPYFRAIWNSAAAIRVWRDRDGYTWSYETSIPHATFDVVDDGELFCRAIVFALNDLKPAVPAQ